MSRELTLDGEDTSLTDVADEEVRDIACEEKFVDEDVAVDPAMDSAVEARETRNRE